MIGNGNGFTPLYVSQLSEYTHDEFIELVKNYVLPSEIKM